MEKKKKGKIKYTDPVKGYGYILADDAADPTDTTMFELKDATSDADELVPGTDVVYEVDQTTSVDRASQVETA